jgi:C-terminal processing protease CtpA/Prc
MKKTTLILLLILASYNLHAQIPNTLNNAQKVYGLSKFWQEVNYNFVYLDKINRATWDSLYVSMINSVQQTKNDYEYYRELQRFCAFLKDGHTNINFPNEIQSKYILNTMFGNYRLMIANIDGKFIVTHTNPQIKEEIPTGTEIIAVNGMATRDYANKNARPYLASSTSYVLDDLCAQNLLQGLAGDTYDIKFKKPNGDIKALHLVHERTTNLELYPAIEDKPLLELKWYPNQVAYVSLNSFGDRKIDSIFISKLPQLHNAKSLIIDLRDNGGGDTGIGIDILRYLTNDQLLFGAKSSTRLHIAANKAWGRFDKPADTVKNAWATKNYLDFLDKRDTVLGSARFSNNISDTRIIVPTVLLIGHETASAAEDFLISADKQKHMVKIGQNSFGSTGQPFLFDLPGGGSARVCTKKDTYPDGREFVGYGVKPDIEVKPTINDFINNNDPALNRALIYLKNKK